jgi:serine/threonine-protein kinase RsbT
MASVAPAWESDIALPADLERARREVHRRARLIGLGVVAAESVMLATMELGSNLLHYATCGILRISDVEDGRRRGILVESRDAGPGIADVSRALTDGYSTGGGLGSGLPAVRRLMDAFTLDTSPEWTIIMAWKWLR